MSRIVAEGLSAPNPRDNSRNCTGVDGLGCVQSTTKDAISVYFWPTEATARHQADVLGAQGIDRAFPRGRTAAAGGRPKYEEVLKRLISS